MRKSAELDSLFPKTCQQVLAATILQPERWWYLSELANHFKVTPSTLQREVQRLVNAEILVQRSDGNRVYYRCNQQCPILSDLQGLLTKTVGVVALIREALRPVSKKIETAFIFGSFAESKELATSDVDLMVIGSLGLAAVAPLLSKVEARIERPVNPVILTAAEARMKLKSRHHFLESVRKGNKLYLWGKDSELGQAFSREKG